MSLRTFFTGWKSPLRRRRSATVRETGAQQCRGRRLRVEVLEERAMMTYGFDDVGYGLALAPNGDFFPNDLAVGIPGARQINLPSELGHDEALVHVAWKVADGSWVTWFGGAP